MPGIPGPAFCLLQLCDRHAAVSFPEFAEAERLDVAVLFQEGGINETLGIAHSIAHETVRHDLQDRGRWKAESKNVREKVEKE